MRPEERLEYSPIAGRAPLRLPGGARMVVWTIVNVEEWDIDRPMPRTVLTPPAGGSPKPQKDAARVMALVVHPCIMGAPHRLKYYRKALERIRKNSDVAFWTGEQILEWYAQHSPSSS